jgi:hypothetical protein
MAVRLPGQDRSVAARAAFEGSVGQGFCSSVCGFLTFAILGAALVSVFWAVTVDACLEMAVGASEDPAVELAVVVLGFLERFFAAVHADVAFQQLLEGVPLTH